MFVIPTLMPLALFGTWLLMNLPTFTLMKFASIIVKWEDPNHQKEEDETQEERRFLAVDDQWTKVNTTGKGSHKHDKYSTELRLQHYKNMETRIAWEITHIKHNLQGRLTKMRPRICTTLSTARGSSPVQMEGTIHGCLITHLRSTPASWWLKFLSLQERACDYHYIHLNKSSDRKW